jgi:hypothetical protein
MLRAIYCIINDFCQIGVQRTPADFVSNLILTHSRYNNAYVNVVKATSSFSSHICIYSFTFMFLLKDYSLNMCNNSVKCVVYCECFSCGGKHCDGTGTFSSEYKKIVRMC